MKSPPESERLTFSKTDSHVSATGIRVLAIQGILISLLLNPVLLSHMLPMIFGQNPRRLLVAGVLQIFGLLVFGWAAWRAPVLGRATFARFAFRRAPIVGNLLFAFGIVILIFFFQEIFFFSLNVSFNPMGEIDIGRNKLSEPYTQRDALLGSRGIPNACSKREVYIVGQEQPLFSPTYHLDERGFRVVPQRSGDKGEHLATFGCSFMFGDGCNDDETLPAQLACLHPDTAVYCFAFPGYSPSQAALQTSIGILDSIEQRAGAALYLFIPDHLNRIVAGGHPSTSSNRILPAFELDASGAPQYKGTLFDLHPGRFALNDFVTALNAPRFLGVYTIFPPDAARFALTAALLQRLREGYQAQFPGNELYVLLHPICHEPGFDAAPLLRELDRRGLHWLDPIGLPGDKKDGTYYFPVDDHPTPLSHTLLAEWLVQQFPEGFAAGPKPPARQTGR